MIIKEFKIENINLNYFVGVNQIQIQDNLNLIFDLIKKIQHKYKDTILQFFNDIYVLNTEHIYNASYFVQKAFLYKNNILKKKDMEFLLYLAANRQIKKGLQDFGINKDYLKKERINFCLISSTNLINQINEEIKKSLNAQEVEFKLNSKSVQKYSIVKSYFNFSNNQIKSILNSYGIEINILKPNIENLNRLYLALNDLICEKMALLSLEKTNIN